MAVQSPVVRAWDGSLQWPGAAVEALAAESGLFVPGAAVVWAVAFGAARAFLCMPRWAPGVAATLAWVPWPGAGRMRPFPSWAAQARGRCDNLQSVVSAAVDRLPRLWVLDEGDDLLGCRPKFLVFDRLRGQPTEVARHVVRAPGVRGLRHMALDPGGERAFASSGASGALLVYCLREHSSWVVAQASAGGPMAFLGSVLYLTPREGSSELHALRDPSPGGNASLEVVGSLLGPASALAADPSGALLYFLQRDHAVVRWDTSRALRAESHDVVLQDDLLLPRVPHIALDSHGVPWALAAPNASSGWCVRLDRRWRLNV